MIKPELYIIIYLITITILTVVHMMGGRVPFMGTRNTNGRYFSFLLLFIVVSLFIGFRPISEYFADMPQYQGAFDRDAGTQFFFQKNADNIIYDNLLNLFVSLSVPPRVWYVLISFLYFGGIFFVTHRLFYQDRIISVLFYLAAFSTFSYATNGIKAGAAASIFLFAIAYNKKPVVSVALALLSYGFHHAMILPIVTYFISMVFKYDNWILVIWFLTLLCAALHITVFQTIFAGLIDEHGAEYLQGVHEQISGFRIDFILYSCAPIFIRYIIPSKNLTVEYRLLWRTYTLANALWLLCMYASFTNRIAYLSWFMYPLILLYPFVHDKGINGKYTYLRLVVYLHLGFTLFMELIYYGALSS